MGFKTLCSSVLLLVLSAFQSPGKYVGLSTEDQMLYAFIHETAKNIEQKYQLRQCASGLGGPTKLRLIKVSFEKIGDALTEEKARELIIRCVDDFLKAINSSEALKPLLENYPFEPKNLDLTIFSYTSDHNYHYYPDIFVVSNTNGKIAFLTEIPNQKAGYYTEKEETYEEAVALLKKGRNESAHP